MDAIEQARASLDVKRLFGEPVVKNGVTVIPVARLRGGAGGGEDKGQDRGGGGFGIDARPTGAFVIRGDEVRWQPALDLNRVILGGQLVAIAALLVVRSILRARARG